MSLNKPGRASITLIISSMMMILYLSLAYLFIGTDYRVEDWPRPRRVYIGLVILGWGVFRGVMTWLRYKRMKEEDEEL